MMPGMGHGMMGSGKSEPKGPYYKGPPHYLHEYTTMEPRLVLKHTSR